jgi:Trypsin-like peptidase domain
MNWHQIVKVISPYIFKIETPRGHGTGFLCLYNETKTLVGIATAHHVIDEADQWQEPIRIRHHESNTTVLLKEADRFILGSQSTDSAVILFQPGILELPKMTIPLLPSDKRLKIGVEIGWLGFPAMEPHTLCFFSGNISARQRHRHAYLIDGVAINGVSGGPVFDDGEDGRNPRIIGTIAAYIANRVTGDTLPGLAYAQDVSHFHDITSKIKSLDEANRQKEQLEQKIPPASSPIQEQPQISPQEELPLMEAAPNQKPPSE